MQIISEFFIPAILILLTFAFGFLLSRLGKPYNGLVFNLHKLTALAAVVLGSIQTYNLMQGSAVQPVLLVLAAVCILEIIALFATGALMSIGKLPHAPLLLIHRIALVFLPLAAAGMAYILASNLT
jgi:hypothetical protein